MKTVLIRTTDCTAAQLVAAWNVLMFSLRIPGDKSNLGNEIAAIKKELDARSIPNAYGLRIRSN